jgi:hypothetical protein
MNFDTSSRVPIFAVPHVYLCDNTIKVVKRTIGLNSIRSVGNIRLWTAYLPMNCIDTMIKMGWDRTT